MRARGRKQGRFVALSGLRKVPGSPGSRFPLLVIDAAGLPIFPLCDQNIYSECGLHYSSYVRNEEAIALFRASSAYLTEKKQRTKRKQKTNGVTCSQPSPRDPLLNYKKPQLVMRLREAQQQIQDLQQQLAVLADACLQRDARVVELEAKLAELNKPTKQKREMS